MHPDLPPLNRFPLAREHSKSAEMIAEANLYLSNLKLQTTLLPQAHLEHMQTADLAGLIPKNVLTEALVCPNGPYDRTLTITRAAILFFIADDYMDSTFEAKHNFLREIKNILNGHPDPGVSGLAREIRDLFKTFATTSTEPEYRQYVRVTHEWFKVNGGAYQFHTFARYAAGIYVSDEQLSDPLLSRCLDLGIGPSPRNLNVECLPTSDETDITIIENDLASYEKEIVHEKQPNGRPALNLVGLILRHGADDRQFMTALDVRLFLRMEIERYEEMFHASLSTALSDMDDKGVPKSDHRRHWLYNLPYIISGNTWWGQTCSRYNIPGKPVLRKIIHLEGGGDIIEPEPACMVLGDSERDLIYLGGFPGSKLLADVAWRQSESPSVWEDRTGRLFFRYRHVQASGRALGEPKRTPLADQTKTEGKQSLHSGPSSAHAASEAPRLSSVDPSFGDCDMILERYKYFVVGRKSAFAAAINCRDLGATGSDDLYSPRLRLLPSITTYGIAALGLPGHSGCMGYISTAQASFRNGSADPASTHGGIARRRSAEIITADSVATPRLSVTHGGAARQAAPRKGLNAVND
ncbi:hypothetical protein DFH08DRAFT_821696 [Mycena albidolilacea]|uniref:Uncharacterized protein n=1 Tax=Mycena albidolilacea TaxID=1033008 RepID=A0AAD6Z9I7_9AGAR|nr:hypothetical protein DFH08DRAFT_821696 [Mycena albidolilacea]